MERLLDAFRRRQRSASYEPLEADNNDEAGHGLRKRHFSWLEYSIFLLLGIAMLWAW
jgi:solute carrier family 29 (equilibrative nucleoside transporter), member 1/2/3